MPRKKSTESKLAESALQDLIAKAQNGDTEAFGNIYDQFVDGIYRYCAFRVAEDLAEDLTADIFTKAWEKLHTYKLKKKVPFGAWLFRIARHTVIDAYRKQQDVLEIPEELTDEDALNRADSHVQKKEYIAVVRKAIARLPKRYREVVELAYLAELPNDEIARVLRMTTGGVRVLKFRALKKLETLLPPDLRDHFE